MNEAEPTIENGHRLVYRVYDDEQRAARAAELLVEAGFSAPMVHIGVQRNGHLQEAHAGHKFVIGLAMLVGGTVSATIGCMLVAAAAEGLITMPLGVLTGLSSITAAILAIAPAAIPGALLGWLVGELRFRHGSATFPSPVTRGSAFVGVEVSPGNQLDAELTLTPAKSALIARSDDWRNLAERTLH